MGYVNLNSLGFLNSSVFCGDAADWAVRFVKYDLNNSPEDRKLSDIKDGEFREYVQAVMQATAKDRLVIEGKCYVGLTANFVQSLAAHGIDHHEETGFFCMKLPADRAEECRRAVMATGGFEPVTDPANDFTAVPSGSPMYIYIYKISPDTCEKIDVSGFTPLKQLPGRPIAAVMTFTDGTVRKQYYDSFTEADCEGLMGEIREQADSGQLMELKVTHRMFNFIYALFGEGCCIINYDSGTSQDGGYQSYRSGERSRKPVKLYKGEYPEYMLCRDMRVLEDILRYFILKGKKPGKRQNVKWVAMKEEE